MSDRIDDIMKNYNDGIKKIDDKYEVKKARVLKKKDTKEIEQKIEYEKEFIKKLEWESETANKDLIEKSKERLANAIKEKQALDEENKKIDERNEKAQLNREEKLKSMNELKNSMVTLDSGREVTQKEKDKIDKTSLKDKAIRELTQESKSISDQLLSKKAELESKREEWNNFKYEFEKDENGNSTGKVTNEDVIKKIHEDFDNIKKEMTQLNEMQEKCQKYLDQLKEKTVEQEKMENAWKYFKKEESPRQDPPRQDPPRQDPPRQDPPEQDNLYKIKIGRKAKISIGDYEFNVGKKEIKQGINLSQEEVVEILNQYLDKNEEKLLAEQLVKDENMDKTILTVIDKSNIDQKEKKDIINAYLNKCLLPNEENNIEIEYDAKELSKVSIFGRIFKKELNNNEKNELLLRAKKASEKDIASVNGNYKINWKEKIFGRFGGTLRMPEATDIQEEAAYEYNKNIYGKNGKEFKESMKVAKENMTKEGYKELKSIAKDQKKEENSQEDPDQEVE